MTSSRQEEAFDWAQFGQLVRTNIRRDFRVGHTTDDRPERKLPPVFWVAAQFSVITTFVAIFVIRGHMDIVNYSFILLSASMVMTSLSVIAEFSSVVVSPDDGDVLGHVPISRRTYFLARLASLLFYVLVLGLGLTLTPALLGLKIKLSTWRFVPAFLLGGALANVFAAGLIVSVYSILMRFVSGSRLRDAIAMAQIGITLVVFVAYMFLGQTLEAALVIVSAEHPSWWLWAAPPIWYASLVTCITLGKAPSYLGISSALGLLAIVAIVLGPMRRLSLHYAEFLAQMDSRGGSKTDATTRGRASWPAALRERLLRRVVSGDARSGYDFCLAMVRHDRTFKIRFYPSFAMPLAIIVVGMAKGSLGDPMVAGLKGQEIVFSLTAIGMVAFSVSTGLALLPFNDCWKAGWVFRAAPIGLPGAILDGAKKMFLIQYFLPLCLGLWVFFAVRWWDPWHALIHCGMGLAYTSCVLHVASAMALDDYPFCAEPQRGGMQARMLRMLLVIMGGTIVYGFLLYAAYLRPDTTALMVGATVLASWVAGRRSRKIIDRRMNRSRLPAAREAVPREEAT